MPSFKTIVYKPKRPTMPYNIKIVTIRSLSALPLVFL